MLVILEEEEGERKEKKITYFIYFILIDQMEVLLQNNYLFS